VLLDKDEDVTEDIEGKIVPSKLWKDFFGHLLEKIYTNLAAAKVKSLEPSVLTQAPGCEQNPMTDMTEDDLMSIIVGYEKQMSLGARKA
jgi:phosphoribosyl-dephospho-CoA transferase